MHHAMNSSITFDLLQHGRAAFSSTTATLTDNSLEDIYQTFLQGPLSSIWWVVVALYSVIICSLAVYGFHRSFLVVSCKLGKKRIEAVENDYPVDEEDLPTVTVQLPLFNEANVVNRLIDAVVAIDYPRDRIQIQVLDDSTDETQGLARKACERYAAQGIQIVYHHRSNRYGYKAGALAEGLKTATGELIAIFDADFVPMPDFLRRLVGHFYQDGKLACVQARWGHLNREYSLLTRLQALMLDGHHLVENRGRYANNQLFNFSGTGGIWRKAAIEDAGGWEHDTVTEDLDLSYRAQLKGWHFLYRSTVIAPAEVPEDLSAYRAQQYRWAKGTVQNFRKLLGRVWRNKSLSISQKIEATFHFTPHFTSPLMVFLAVMLVPMFALFPGADPISIFLIGIPIASASFGSLLFFYMYTESTQGRSRLNALKLLPALMALGAGMSPWIARAVFEGISSNAGEFVRTPKKGDSSDNRQSYLASIKLPFLEYILCVWSTLATIVAIRNEHWVPAPFACLFALGFGYVAFQLTLEQIERRRAARRSLAPTPGI